MALIFLNSNIYSTYLPGSRFKELELEDKTASYFRWNSLIEVARELIINKIFFDDGTVMYPVVRLINRNNIKYYQCPISYDKTSWIYFIL